MLGGGVDRVLRSVFLGFRVVSGSVDSINEPATVTPGARRRRGDFFRCRRGHRRGAAACWWASSPRSSSFCDRKGPMVFKATEEPIFFLRLVLAASCAHVQSARVLRGGAGCWQKRSNSFHRLPDQRRPPRCADSKTAIVTFPDNLWSQPRPSHPGGPAARGPFLGLEAVQPGGSLTPALDLLWREAGVRGVVARSDNVAAPSLTCPGGWAVPVVWQRGWAMVDGWGRWCPPRQTKGPLLHRRTPAPASGVGCEQCLAHGAAGAGQAESQRFWRAGQGGWVGTRPWCWFVCLWRRPLASRHCTF